jgi:hypothetical protein
VGPVILFGEVDESPDAALCGRSGEEEAPVHGHALAGTVHQLEPQMVTTGAAGPVGLEGVADGGGSQERHRIPELGGQEGFDRWAADQLEAAPTEHLFGPRVPLHHDP